MSNSGSLKMMAHQGSWQKMTDTSISSILSLFTYLKLWSLDKQHQEHQFCLIHRTNNCRSRYQMTPWNNLVPFFWLTRLLLGNQLIILPTTRTSFWATIWNQYWIRQSPLKATTKEFIRCSTWLLMRGSAQWKKGSRHPLGSHVFQKALCDLHYPNAEQIYCTSLPLPDLLFWSSAWGQLDI